MYYFKPKLCLDSSLFEHQNLSFFVLSICQQQKMYFFL